MGGYPPYEDIYEKLYRENINKDTKNLATRDLKECTFTPKVNPISNLLVSNNGQNYNNNLDDYEVMDLYYNVLLFYINNL